MDLVVLKSRVVESRLRHPANLPSELPYRHTNCRGAHTLRYDDVVNAIDDSPYNGPTMVVPNSNRTAIDPTYKYGSECFIMHLVHCALKVPTTTSKNNVRLGVRSYAGAPIDGVTMLARVTI